MFETQSSYRALMISFVVATAIVAGGGYYFYQKSKPHIKPELPPKVAEKAAPAIPNLPKTPSVAQVLTDLFAIKVTTDKVNNTPEQLSSLWFQQTFKHGQEPFHVVFIKTQTLDPETKALLDSHADGANISAVVYKQTGPQWQLFSKQINIGTFGSWGDAPALTQVPTLQLSENNLAFLIESGSSGQGYTDEGKGLLVFNPKLKVWKDLGFIQTGGDNAGACDDQPKQGDTLLSACWKFTGEIALVKSGKNSEYPALLVEHKGTTSDENNKIVPMKNRLYLFNGEQYVESDTEAR